MNCSRFKSQLQTQVEARALLSSHGLREHLSECTDPACREAWLEACLLEQAIGEWTAGIPESNFGERVISELRLSAATSGAETPAPPVRVSREIPSPAGRSSSRWIVLSAALLVLLSLLAVLTLPGPGTTPDSSIAESPTPPDANVAPPALDEPLLLVDAPPPQRDETELSTAYLGYAENATHFLTDTVALTLAGEEDIEDPTAAADWIHRVEARLSPLGENFDAALDQFLRTIPDSET